MGLAKSCNSVADVLACEGLSANRRRSAGRGFGETQWLNPEVARRCLASIRGLLILDGLALIEHANLD